ncbi:MAG: radical SAM protein, partial [Desulfurococcales archaeon]|nr:radical SAM protein [Desulfurococcales archaeon]
YRSSGGPLMKVLLSSACMMDCRYCPFSRYCRVPRERWPPGKLARAFTAAWQMGLVGGLFLSSGLYGDPERVAGDMVEEARRVRELGFRGYIALRLMPGTPKWLVREALGVADRVGVNLEAPSPSGLAEIAPSKGSWSLDLLGPLLYAAREARDPRRVSTQLVLGAAGETDEEHVTLAARLLGEGVGVIYYSPYTPVPGTPLARRRPPTPAWRARLLSEAVALMRDYGYDPRWILDALDDRGMLPRPRSPGETLKDVIARLHPEWYPVDPSTAGWSELVRVPGIGPKAASRILRAREAARGARLDAAVKAILGPARYRRARRYLHTTH